LAFLITTFTMGATHQLEGASWKQCDHSKNKCFELKARTVGQSIFSQKWFAQDVELRLKNTVLKAKRSLWDEKEDRWTLLEARSKSDPTPHDYFFFTETQRLVRYR
jgi:hypothetical protein